MPQNTSLERVPFFRPDPAERLMYKKTAHVPVVNIDETDEHYLLTVAVPGFKREQFEILISDQIIFISATKKDIIPKSVKERCEYDYTNWSRAFILPDDTDIILAKASYHNGELIIRIPRGEGDTIIKDTLTVYVD
jgi:HSP20 family protein